MILQQHSTLFISYKICSLNLVLVGYTSDTSQPNPYLILFLYPLPSYHLSLRLPSLALRDLRLKLKVKIHFSLNMGKCWPNFDSALEASLMAEKETVITEHAFIQSQIIPVNHILARVLARRSVHRDVDGQNRYTSFNGVLKAYTDLGLLGKNDYGTHLKVAKFLSVNPELLTVPCCDTNIKSVIKNTLLKRALDCYDHDYSCENRFHFLYQDGDSKSKKRSLRYLINLLDQHGKKEGIAKFRLYRRNRKKDQRKRRKSSQQSHEPSHGEYCA